METRNPRRVDGLEFQEAGDEILVHDSRAQKIHVLNKSARRVLDLCDGSPLSSLVDAMMPAPDFDRARVQRDVEKILAQFYELGLVKPVASTERMPQ